MAAGIQTPDQIAHSRMKNAAIPSNGFALNASGSVKKGKGEFVVLRLHNPTRPPLPVKTGRFLSAASVRTLLAFSNSVDPPAERA